MKDERYLKYPIYNSADESTIFRFDTEYSSCHSFNDKPPTKWEDVYKVYYYYQIVHIDKEDGEEKILFDSHCDECSILDEIVARCEYLAKGNKKVKITRDDGTTYTVKLLNQEIKPCGMGVFWTIRKPHKKYQFELFDWWDKGYRFWINEDKIEEFGKFLQSCCEYMLEHGVPI